MGFALNKKIKLLFMTRILISVSVLAEEYVS